MKWEYLVRQLEFETQTAHLNQLGGLGWQLISVVERPIGLFAYLGRPVYEAKLPSNR